MTGAAPGPVQAQATWNTGTYTTAPVFIPFVGGAMSSTNPGTVDLRVGTGNATTSAFTMDTGSTGIVATADNFKPGPTDVALGSGSITYTSSGKIENGTFYQTNVAIESTAGGTHTVATAQVTALLVTSITCQANARDCTPNADPKGVAFMGIGFDRGTSAAANANPFTSLTSISTGPVSGLHSGYMITNEASTPGVYLGLPTSIPTRYSLVKLTPDIPVPINLWLNAPVTIGVKVAGASAFVTGAGTMLPDSGVDYMLLAPPAGSGLTAGQDAPDGTKIAIYLPGQINPLGQYQLDVGHAADNPLKPDKVTVVGGAVFVNTGREFYNGFDYFYDAAGGYVGYASTDSHATVNPGVALVGNISLQDTFSSSLPVFLMDATTLLAPAGGSALLSGVVSGSGGLTIGSGQINLTGVNSYTGGTTVSGGAILGILADSGLGDVSGRLKLDGGTLLSLTTPLQIDRAVTLGPAGGIVDTTGADIKFTKAVSGAGGLTKQGANILTLSGASSYSGGTTVNGGTLRLDVGASLLATGALTVNAGTFDLNGNNLTMGDLSGAGGTLALGAGTLTLGDADNSSSATLITGSGKLQKQGSGVLTLTGNSTAYSGQIEVAAGRLAIDGNIGTAASIVTVDSGGNLGGIGTITGSVTNNGILSPGNSIGTLTVNGSYTQAPGSFYQVEANALAQNDRLNVIGAPGTATILGGTVAVLPVAAGVYAPSTTYTILNATGGVTGTYAGVTSSLPFLQPSLSYDANDVYLTLKPGGFARGAATANQAAAGGVLDRNVAGASGDFATVIGTMATLSSAQGQVALNAISGQAYSGFGTSSVKSGALFMNAVGQQMGFTHGSGGAAGGNRVALAVARDAPSADRASDFCDADGAGREESRWGAWLSAIGGLGSVLGNGNAQTLTYNMGGTAVGADYRIDPHFLVGVSVAYGSGTQWTSGVTGSGTTDSFNTSVYGSFTSGAAYVDALAGYAYNDSHMTRTIVIPGLSPRTAFGRAGANQFLGQVEAGYKVGLSAPVATYVTPFARLQASTNSQAAFSETGANSLDLSVAQQTTNSLRSVIGIDLGGAFDLGWREKLALQFRLGWGHEYADLSRPVSAAFAGAPASGFTVFGAAPQRDGAVLGLSASTAIAERIALYLRYDGEVGGGTSNQAISAGVRVVW